MDVLKNQLAESHKDLHQWFLFHQECLLLGEDILAMQAYDAFMSYLQKHIQFENQYLLNDMRLNDGRWPLEVYRKEHDKLDAMLVRLSQMLVDYQRLQGRRKRLALLELLDYEQTLRHVMEHHEEREEMDLFSHVMKVNADWQTTNLQLQMRYADLKNLLKAKLEEG